MFQVPVSFDTIDHVKQFNQTVSSFPFDFDLICGRYVVDAKSILGIYSLDLSRPLELAVHTDDPAEKEAVMKSLQDYIQK